MTTDIHSCSYYCGRSACVKAQRDELREKLEVLQTQHDKMTLMHAQRTVERDALQADALRYRWLKDGAAYDGWFPSYYNGRGVARHEFTLNTELRDLDAAIDEAMK